MRYEYGSPGSPSDNPVLLLYRGCLTVNSRLETSPMRAPSKQTSTGPDNLLLPLPRMRAPRLLNTCLNGRR